MPAPRAHRHGSVSPQAGQSRDVAGIGTGGASAGRPAAELAVTRLVLFGVGLSIGLVMVLRSQLSSDQFQFFVMGWKLYALGEWLPYGASMSGGGLNPGGLTALVVGLPLFVWEDYRAPGLLLLLLHGAAYLLLDRTLRDIVGSRERLLFCVLYWLNPWRLCFSTFAWNPNWLFPLGALHLHTAFRQRHTASPGYSLLHVLSIGLAFQLHGSFLILAVVTLLLVWRGFVKLHWGGTIAAGLLMVASLVPWVIHAWAHPEIMPAHAGFLGRGLVYVYPLLRGVLYWLRYASLYFGREMVRFDFTSAFGPAADAVLTPLILGLWRIVAPLTVGIALVGNVWLWRRDLGPRFPRYSAEGSPREWILGATRLTFLGAVLTFCLSYNTIMMWHALIIVHMAVLPSVLAVGQAWSQGSRGLRRWIPRGIAIYAAFTILFSVAMSIASPMFRVGGRHAARITVRQMYPLLTALGIDRRNTIVLDPEAGATMNLLERAPTRAERAEVGPED